jgi:hypothetical protein
MGTAGKDPRNNVHPVAGYEGEPSDLAAGAREMGSPRGLPERPRVEGAARIAGHWATEQITSRRISALLAIHFASGDMRQGHQARRRRWGRARPPLKTEPRSVNPAPHGFEKSAWRSHVAEAASRSGRLDVGAEPRGDNFRLDRNAGNRCKPRSKENSPGEWSRCASITSLGPGVGA